MLLISIGALAGLFTLWIVAVRPQYLLFICYLLLIFLHAPPINGEYLKVSFNIGSITVHPQDIILFVLLFGLIRTWIFSKSSNGFNIGKGYIFLFVIFVLWHFIRFGIAVSIDIKNIEMVLRMMAGRAFVILIILIPFFGKEYGYNWEKLRIFFLLSGAIIPIFGLMNMVITPDGILLTSSGTARYLTGTANIYLGFCFILAISGVRARWFPRFIGWPYAFWMLIGMAFTQHRTVVVALISVFIIDTLLFSDIKEKLIRSFSVSIVILLFIISAHGFFSSQTGFIGDTWKRTVDTFDLKNKTTLGRLAKWEKRLQIVKKKPWLGIGIGREPALYRKQTADKLKGHEAHNFIVSILTYEGIIGLIVNMAIIFYALKHSIDIIRKTDLPGREIPFVFFIYYFVYSIFNTTYFNTLTSPLFITLVGTIAFLKNEIPKYRPSS